jgi:hypothetical protein
LPPVKVPPRASRATHGKALEKAFTTAVTEARRRREKAGVEIPGAVPGLYVQFGSPPNVQLKRSSLEDARHGIEWVAVTEVSVPTPKGTKPQRIERATVFVPGWKVKQFVSRFESCFALRRFLGQEG